MKVKYITREDAIHCDIATSKDMIRELINPNDDVEIYIVHDLDIELNEFLQEWVSSIPRKPTLVMGYVAVEGSIPF